jgi:thymidylate kinase
VSGLSRAERSGIAHAIDAAAAGRVLVFGSPPPGGGDLDLLARPAEEAAVVAVLRAEGFVARGRQWASFRTTPPAAVELVPAAAWRLPGPALAALFDDAVPLPGFARLVTPAPHHVVLLSARRLVGSGGRLPDKARARLDDALAADPSAWARAEALAPAWRATAAMAALDAFRRGDRPPLARARLERLRRPVSRRPRRRTIVALSGLDGSGKSSQATDLREALEALGVDAVVVWPPAKNVLFRAPQPAKAALRRLLGVAGTGLPATAAALAQVLALRRHLRGTAGKVVIFDRAVLDAVVYVRQRWADGRPLPFQSWLVRALSPRPDRAYLLEIAPETAFARKQDYPLDNLRQRAALYHQLADRLGVRRLDAGRPRRELFEQIAADVWQVGR